MSAELLLLERSAAATTVVFNDPDNKNRLDDAMVDALHSTAPIPMQFWRSEETARAFRRAGRTRRAGIRTDPRQRSTR
jgi:hypothetical protein